LAPSPGDRLGAYEIVAPLGSGGMGEVYRARDTKLGREVAIKLLPAAVAQDADRLSRFKREAQVLAALNHPNIAAIYGLEDGGDAQFLVLELVEGEDLADRLKRGRIPLDDTLAIAKQIADALAEAHDKGIVHRDLKPANVKLTPDGKVKVLDFGLAKAVVGEISGSGAISTPTIVPTMTSAGTAIGMILGTAAYMSPEQARGKPVDKRTDVWAFGCVLYEMLTGSKAFEGDDITETLAAIVRGEPDWTRLPADLPPAVRVLLTRCLIKDRAERLSDISVVRFLMTDTAHSLSGAAVATGTAAPAATRRRVAPIVVATAAVAVAATFGLTHWLMPAGPAQGDAIAHVSIELPDGVEIGAANVLPFAISDDGARVAFAGLQDGKTRIYVRALNEPEAKVLEGTEGGDGPFFSPDGQWIGFFAGSKLRKIAVGGAALQTLADAPTHRGGDWGRDGYIYFAPSNIGGIWRVPEGGGAATEVTRKEPEKGEVSHRWPRLVADTNTLLFSVWTGPGDDEHHVAVQTLGTTEHHLLVKGGDAPRYAAKLGALLYSHLGELFVVPWRPSQTDLGKAVPVAAAEHPNDGIGNEGCGNYAVSDNGTLAYLAGGRTRRSTRLVWIDRAGKLEPAALPDHNYENVVISPDGTRAIVQINEGITALWMYDIGRSTLTPVGSSAGSSQAPLWTADGTRVLYRGTRQGTRNLYWRLVDGSGDEERLTSKPDVVQTPTSASSDGQWLLFSEGGPQQPGGTGVWVMRLNGDRTPRPFFIAPAGESDAQISPDGRWIAYQAPISSRQEIYVSPFPGPGPRQQVSTDGGIEPLWSRDGRELFFQQGAQLMAVTVAPGAAFSASAPRLVHEGRFFRTINGNTSWSITPDGGRILRIQNVAPERAITQLELVLNWYSEVKQRGAGGAK
jgi:eukaryotic-like serine/threonine-protein kinase